MKIKIFALIAAVAAMASCDLLNRQDKNETDSNFTAIQGVWYGVSSVTTDVKGNVTTDDLSGEQMEFLNDGTVVARSSSGAEVTMPYSVKESKLTLGAGEMTTIWTIVTLDNASLVISTVDEETSDKIELRYSRTKVE